MGYIPQEFRLETYDYSLPEELIAYYPPPKREESKLLVIDRKKNRLFFHESFAELLTYFQEGDLLVLNKTKVFPARLKVKKRTGGKAEVLLFDKPQGFASTTQALLKGKGLKEGLELISEKGEILLRIKQKLENGRYFIELHSLKDEPLEKLITVEGKAPLPPYIKREPNEDDLLRYQTVYAEEEGAIAAPTAGLHFTKELLKELENKGVLLKYLTLHVGYGTFKPIKTQDIRKHVVDPEYIKIPEDTVEEVKRALKEGRRVIACGTTTTRALEYIAQKGFVPYEGLCDLYIYPGYSFKVVSSLITNFHLPKSSLLLLVCAFAGRSLIMKAYEEAIKRKYRFYSYGDATFII